VATRAAQGRRIFFNGTDQVALLRRHVFVTVNNHTETMIQNACGHTSTAFLGRLVSLKKEGYVHIFI
jgi:hypothetical protein